MQNCFAVLFFGLVLTFTGLHVHVTSIVVCDKRTDSFLNVCGMCVNGSSSGSNILSGLDKCQVCFGGNECDVCWNAEEKEICSKCFGGNSKSDEGCTFVSSIHPNKIDLASSLKEVKLVLIGPGITRSNLNTVTCKLKQSASSDGTEVDLKDFQSVEIEADGIHLDIDSSSFTVGSYIIQCQAPKLPQTNSLRALITVVDSRSLSMEILIPQAIYTNFYFEVEIHTFSRPESPKTILCFIKTNGLVEMIVKSEILSDGRLMCKSMITKYSSAVFFGISESVEAILENSSELKLKKLDVNSPGPVMRRSSFSPDLRQIHVEFDENIESVKHCQNAFSADTVSLFGNGWLCHNQANMLIVYLGEEPSVRPGSRISIIPENGIKKLGSGNASEFALESTVIVDDVTNQVIEPLYRLIAPHGSCYTGRVVGFHSSLFSRSSRMDEAKELSVKGQAITVIEVQEMGGQNLHYNWSISFTPVETRSSTKWSQREMLMIWFSVRVLSKSMEKVFSNRIALNNSLMMTGVDYTVSVRGGNFIGMVGEEKKIPIRLLDRRQIMEHRSRSAETGLKACTSGVRLEVVVLSSPATFADAECWVEISLSCCGGQVSSELLGLIDYVWSVRATGGDEVDVIYNHGKRLIILPKTLKGGLLYNVSCVLVHKALNTSLGSASTLLTTLERGIQTNVNVSSIALSSEHPLVLDASSSNDLDNKPGILEFQWSCQSKEISGSFTYGDKQCYVPGPQKSLLSDVYREAFRKPLLWLPPRSLPIGRYLFSVSAKRNSSRSGPNDLVTINVDVVGGSPPLVSVPSRNARSNDNIPGSAISPEDDLTLIGVVTGIKAGCHVSWSCVDKPGYSHLNQSSIRQRNFIAVTSNPNPEEFPMELRGGLIGDAKYCLRLSAICPTSRDIVVEKSFADFEVRTDAPPDLKELRVEPLVGQALVTLFQFSTEAAYDDLLDFPLRYSFGFRIVEPAVSSSLTTAKFFHTTSQQLSVSTYLPALSLDTTKIQTILRVCDGRHICHTKEGPQVSTSAPKNLTHEHVELLSDGFSSFLLSEEYEDAVMAVESSMATLEILDDKSLYELASKRVEQSVNAQLDLIEEKFDMSIGSIQAALRFLNAANAALKQGSFSQDSLQKLVAFKDKVLNVLSSMSGSPGDSQMQLRVKRQNADSERADSSWRILQPDMVRSLLSISEVAIFNLSDAKGALNEKRKLLQNITFFMDSLCRGLRSPTPIFIGSRVVSFSIQRLNLQVKYKDDLAVPDWRSAKSGGAPVNATAMVLLGEHLSHVVGSDADCLGAAFYPMDFLSDIFGWSAVGSYRHSAIYQVKLLLNSRVKQRTPLLESYNGLNVGTQSVQIKIPVWSDQISIDRHLECRVWHQGSWSGLYCKLIKLATLINKPAVECLCSVLGFHAVFAVESRTVQETTTPPMKVTSPLSTQSFTTREEIVENTTPVGVQATTLLPAGIPIPNTLQNFTFTIKENFSRTVAPHPEAFISHLKREILAQVAMPANMITSIDVSPGSILVTLHLVDTDIRTVNDVLPTLAAVLQEGRLSVSGLDGQHLSVPPQSLQLLQRWSERLALPWIVTGCATFSIICIASIIVATLIVKQKQRLLQFSKNPVIPKPGARAPMYGRFHLEQTLDGSEASLSRYRSSNNNPLVVSTVGGMASVMGTNAMIPDSFLAGSTLYKLQSVQTENRPLATSAHTKETFNNSSSGSGHASGSSGNTSISSVQKRIRNGSIHKKFSADDRKPILDCEEGKRDTEESDSGISENTKTSNSGTPYSSDASSGPIVETVLLPGTPTGKGSDASNH